MDRKRYWGLTGAALLLGGFVTLAVTAQNKPAAAPATDRWLHIRVVEAGDKGETVRVNVPLSLAEAILPAIKVHKMNAGRVKVHSHHMDQIDLRAVFEAVQKAADGEFVTVQKGTSEEVRVSKQNGYLLVNVRDDKTRGDGSKHNEKVDVKIPLAVVEAAFSGPNKDEIDVLAAIRALARHSDTQLVAVEDGKTTVRVWIDSKNVSE